MTPKMGHIWPQNGCKIWSKWTTFWHQIGSKICSILSSFGTQIRSKNGSILTSFEIKLDPNMVQIWTQLWSKCDQKGVICDHKSHQNGVNWWCGHKSQQILVVWPQFRCEMLAKPQHSAKLSANWWQIMKYAAVCWWNLHFSLNLTLNWWWNGDLCLISSSNRHEMLMKCFISRPN